MQRISPEEQAAILRVIDYGEQYGYGKLISYLLTAWARSVMKVLECDEATAKNYTHGGVVIPFELQDDILERGEWDETGEKYQ